MSIFKVNEYLVFTQYYIERAKPPLCNIAMLLLQTDV